LNVVNIPNIFSISLFVFCIINPYFNAIFNNVNDTLYMYVLCGFVTIFQYVHN